MPRRSQDFFHFALQYLSRALCLKQQMPTNICIWLIKSIFAFDSPQTISSVHACINGVISKYVPPTNSSKLLTKRCTFSLKIGMNDWRILMLKVEFNTLRCGRHIFTERIWEIKKMGLKCVYMQIKRCMTLAWN